MAKFSGVKSKNGKLTRFGIDRVLVRASEFKELYPIIAERHPELCHTQGRKVSLASMEWLNEIQRDLGEIATNRDGVWHLKDIVPQVPVQPEDSENQIRKGRLKPRRTERRQFPNIEIATLWNAGKSISEIAKAIGRVDHDNPKDSCHSLRNCLRRMHKYGFIDASGQRVKLSYRVSEATISKATIAGRRGKQQ